MIAQLSFFHLVHCSFIFGHGWLHSKQFSKTCQNCFCPSWHCLRCVMAFVGAFTTRQQLHASALHCHVLHCTNSKLGHRQFWHALQKWLLSSHPWPNMNDQCTIWKKNLCYHPLITILWFFFLVLRHLGLKLWFPFFKLTLYIIQILISS